MPPPALASIEAAGLACVRGSRALFRDLNFRVEAGRALVVEGPNGAGKTSLLRLIAGLLAPFGGKVVLRANGAEITEGEERGKFAGWFGHQDGLKSQLTARENLSFFAQLYSGRSDVDAALQWAGLSRAADFPVQYLSAGQKKRLALARLKLSGRPLWLLDEPFAALDICGKKLVEDLISTHCTSGGIAVVATHETLLTDSSKLSLGQSQ